MDRPRALDHRTRVAAGAGVGDTGGGIGPGTFSGDPGGG
jgi:hypothetical protein